MTIDELLKSPESFSRTYRTLLRDVEFSVQGTCLSAFCRNSLEVELIKAVARAEILDGAKEELGIQNVYAAVIGNPVEKSRRSAVNAGVLTSRLERPHPEYVLDSFLANETNAAAFGATIALVDWNSSGPRKTGFLYIYGSEGCGKTHLLHATVNGLVERGKRLLVFDGEEFAQYLLTAATLAGAGREAHLRELHEADGLAVDDIRPIAGAGKQTVQQEFASILDDLRHSGKCGIFTGKYSPMDWHWKLVDDLSDWLVKGQLAEVEAPGGLMREMLAQMVFDRSHLNPGGDVISFVGGADITSVRTLLTLCYQLVAKAYEGGEVTVKLARSLLRKLGIKKGANDEKVVTSALQAMGIGIQLSEMQGAKINRDLKSIRNLAIMQLVKDKELPQSLIAGAFGISTQAVNKIVKGDKKD